MRNLLYYLGASVGGGLLGTFMGSEVQARGIAIDLNQTKLNFLNEALKNQTNCSWAHPTPNNVTLTCNPPSLKTDLETSVTVLTEAQRSTIEKDNQQYLPYWMAAGAAIAMVVQHELMASEELDDADELDAESLDRAGKAQFSDAHMTTRLYGEKTRSYNPSVFARSAVQSLRDCLTPQVDKENAKVPGKSY